MIRSDEMSCALDHLVAEVEDPLQHHRHHDQRRRAVALEAVERLLGIEPPADDERRAEREPEHHVREAERVEHRHAQLGHLAGAERHLAQQRRRSAPASAARCAGRPSACRSCRWSGSRSWGRCRASAARCASRASISASSVSGGVRRPSARSMRASARAAGRCPRACSRVLVVVDEQVGPLAPGDLADLRAGERGVEQHDPGAALGGGEHRVEEAAVVADQDRDPVTRLEALLAPGVGERVGALVELPVGQRRRARRGSRTRSPWRIAPIVTAPAEQPEALERDAASGRRGAAAPGGPGRCAAAARRSRPRRRQRSASFTPPPTRAFTSTSTIVASSNGVTPTRPPDSNAIGTALSLIPAKRPR